MNADEPDALGLSATSPIDSNLFIYCNSNPVNFIDNTGYFGTPLQWVGAALGVVAGVFFGDWLARKIGLNPDGGFWTWKYHAYYAFRAAFIVGGAVFGWVAGVKLVELIGAFAKANPLFFNKLPVPVQRFLCWLTGGAFSAAVSNTFAAGQHLTIGPHSKNG